MATQHTRRAVLVQLLGIAALAEAQSRPRWPRSIRDVLRTLERTNGGRLGVVALDIGTTERFAYRGDERFAMCSTVKVLAVALALSRTERREDRLDRLVPVTAADLVPNSPVTSTAVGRALTLEAVCAAAIVQSDNTAANLLIDSAGGPAAITAYARALGDRVTRLDRREVALNDGVPGDRRDTTSPAAMAQTLRRLVLGDALSDESRQRLTSWMIANERGHGRLRAGFPTDWRIADKPGTGGHGTTNDIAVVWPPHRAPLVVCVYYTESSRSETARESVLARVGSLLSA